jgi:hypothetical protein
MPVSTYRLRVHARLQTTARTRGGPTDWSSAYAGAHGYETGRAHTHDRIGRGDPPGPRGRHLFFQWTAIHTGGGHTAGSCRIDGAGAEHPRHPRDREQALTLTWLTLRTTGILPINPQWHQPRPFRSSSRLPASRFPSPRTAASLPSCCLRGRALPLSQL